MFQSSAAVLYLAEPERATQPLLSSRRPSSCATQQSMTSTSMFEELSLQGRVLTLSITLLLLLSRKKRFYCVSISYIYKHLHHVNNIHKQEEACVISTIQNLNISFYNKNTIFFTLKACSLQFIFKKANTLNPTLCTLL